MLHKMTIFCALFFLSNPIYANETFLKTNSSLATLCDSSEWVSHYFPNKRLRRGFVDLADVAFLDWTKDECPIDRIEMTLKTKERASRLRFYVDHSPLGWPHSLRPNSFRLISHDFTGNNITPSQVRLRITQGHMEIGRLSVFYKQE